LALTAGGAAGPPTAGPADATAIVPPGVDPAVAAARLAVDWHLSMTHIFQAVTPDYHAELLPFMAMCLYYEGRSLVSPSTHPEGRTGMKRVRYIDGALDALDTAILAALAEDARTPMRELAQKVGLSAPSTTERVRRLQAAGVIEGYTVRVNPGAIGLPLGAILRIRPMPGELNRVAQILASIPEITACDRVTGDDCFIAKAQVPSVADLETLINGLLPYASTNTCVVVSTLIAQRLPASSP
jgi:Lrp/AsnC family leucine-responsive transcriptional regulator